jgi:hypothetical protein
MSSKSVRFANTDNVNYILKENVNSTSVKDTIDYILYNSLQTNLLNAINNFNQRNVYDFEEKQIGMNTIIEISPLFKTEIVGKIKAILSDSRFKVEFLKSYRSNEDLFNKIIEKFVESVFDNEYRNEPTLKYFVDIFSNYTEKGKINVNAVILLKLIYPTFNYSCDLLNKNEFEVARYLKRMVSMETSINEAQFLYFFAKHIRLAFGCKFGENFKFPVLTGSGGGVVEYKIYNGHRYKIRIGSKGGKYILVKGDKKYIYTLEDLKCRF